MSGDTETPARVAELLAAIEAELRTLDLWEEEPPPPEALGSTLPFAYDTLDFHQWLQWLFLQRMGELVEQGAALPGPSSIHPMAEHRFDEMELEAVALLELIRELDEVLSR